MGRWVNGHAPPQELLLFGIEKSVVVIESAVVRPIDVRARSMMKIHRRVAILGELRPAMTFESRALKEPADNNGAAKKKKHRAVYKWTMPMQIANIACQIIRSNLLRACARISVGKFFIFQGLPGSSSWIAIYAALQGAGAILDNDGG